MIRLLLEDSVAAWRILGAPDGLSAVMLDIADIETDQYELAEKQGEQKECYYNSAQLTLAHPERYDYVEGFVASDTIPLPIHHGWLWDREREIVVEPTLRRKPGEKLWYLGKRFTAEEYGKISTNWGYWCLFDSAVGPNLELIDRLREEARHDCAA